MRFSPERFSPAKRNLKSSQSSKPTIANAGVSIAQQLVGRDGLDLNGEATPHHGTANINRYAICPKRLSCRERFFREQRKLVRFVPIPDESESGHTPDVSLLSLSPFRGHAE